MDRILSIETSAESCSVALSAFDNTWEKFEHAPRRHAELILPMVHSLACRSGPVSRPTGCYRFRARSRQFHQSENWHWCGPGPRLGRRFASRAGIFSGGRGPGCL